MALNLTQRFLKGLLINGCYLACGWRVGQVRGRILTYHRVDDVKGDRLVVSPDQFRRQMEFLRRRQIRVVDLDTLLASVTHPSKRDNQVAITFDDGYEDNFRHVHPILKGYKYPWTVFVSVGLIGTDAQIPAERPGAAPAMLMTWEQVKGLADDGVTIGSHGMTHTRLTRLSLAEVKAEATDSKRILEEQLGMAADWFCYPAGAVSSDVVQIVQRAGYQGACSVRPGVNTPTTHRFALRRTEVSGADTLLTFQKKMAGAYDTWHALVQQYQHWSRRRAKQAERPHV